MCISVFSQGLHTAGLQDSDNWESPARPSCYDNANFGSFKLHPSVQLRPQGLLREEQTNRLAERRQQQPVTFKRNHAIQFWQQQQQEVS